MEMACWVVSSLLAASPRPHGGAAFHFFIPCKFIWPCCIFFVPWIWSDRGITVGCVLIKDEVFLNSIHDWTRSLIASLSPLSRILTFPEQTQDDTLNLRPEFSPSFDFVRQRTGIIRLSSNWCTWILLSIVQQTAMFFLCTRNVTWMGMWTPLQLHINQNQSERKFDIGGWEDRPSSWRSLLFTFPPRISSKQESVARPVQAQPIFYSDLALHQLELRNIVLYIWVWTSI